MTAKGKAKQIAYDYDKNHRPDKAEYDIGRGYHIEIDVSPWLPDRFDVRLFDDVLDDDEEDGEVDFLVEKRETIIDAVERFLENTMWEE